MAVGEAAPGDAQETVVSPDQAPTVMAPGTPIIRRVWPWALAAVPIVALSTDPRALSPWDLGAFSIELEDRFRAGVVAQHLTAARDLELGVRGDGEIPLDRGVVDLVGTMGLYQISSMMVSLDETPLPNGVKPYLHPAQ